MTGSTSRYSCITCLRVAVGYIIGRITNSRARSHTRASRCRECGGLIAGCAPADPCRRNYLFVNVSISSWRRLELFIFKPTLSLSLFVYLSIYLSIYLSLPLSFSHTLSYSLPINLSIYLSIHSSVYLSYPLLPSLSLSLSKQTTLFLP